MHATVARSLWRSAPGNVEAQRCACSFCMAESLGRKHRPRLRQTGDGVKSPALRDDAIGVPLTMQRHNLANLKRGQARSCHLEPTSFGMHDHLNAVHADAVYACKRRTLPDIKFFTLLTGVTRGDCYVPVNAACAPRGR